MKKIVVLYHANCTDGFTAAWAASKKFGRTAEYIPVVHQQPVPEGLKGKEIYLLDFTYPGDVMEDLKARNRRVTAIDHHASMREVTLATEGGVFDNDHSGAALAWTYFNPDAPVPFLVRIVEDWDLHRYAIPETPMLFDWLDLYDFDFKVFNKLARTLGTAAGLRRAVRQGTILQAYRERHVRSMVERDSYEVQFGEYRVLAVTTRIYHHEVGTALAKDRPFGLTWRAGRNGIYVSLRSRDNVDVSRIAEQYGGSGHRNAAGFTVATLADLPFKPISND